MLVGNDVGCGVGPLEKCLDRFAVRAHMGAIGIKQQAGRAFAAGHEAAVQLEFAVLAVSAAEGPVQVDAIGYDGHSEDAVAKRPGAVVVLGHSPYGVAARVGGVVPGAVVVHGPVHELEVAVGADIVEIEEIRQRHLAQAKFDAADGNAGRQSKEVRLLADDVVREADDLVDLVARGIRIDAEIWIPDHVDVRLPGQPQRLAQSTAAGRFQIEDQVSVVTDGVSCAHGGVERSHQRGFIFGGVAEAVRSLIGRVERETALEDDVGLA